MWKWVMGAALAVTAMPAEAQTAATPLTLERVFASPDLSGTTPRQLTLSPDGKYLTLLRNRADERDRFDLWAMDTATGEWRMLVDSKRVGTGAALSEAERMQRERARIGGTLGIVAYRWAPDGKSILVPLDGDLYLAGLDGSVRRLTQSQEGELNPTLSPRGGFVAFVRDRNLWVQPLSAGGEARQVTTGTGSTVSWGEAEFVAQEEMGRSTGYWWSPDDARIAVARFDEAPVGVISRAAIGADGTQIYQQRYPRAGTPNVLIDLYVMRPDGSGLVKVDLGAERDIYLARVDWTPDGKALIVQRQSRDQKTLDVLRVDPATGAATRLFTERSATFVQLSDAYRLLGDGSMIWWSERDGFAHLYRYANGRFTQLTRGAWEVADLVGVDERRGRLFFTGNRDGVLERHLYSLDLARPGNVRRLTETGFWNDAKMDGEGRRAIVTRSNPDQPPHVYLADADGRRVAWVKENALTGDHPYAPHVASHRETRFGTIPAADGSDLHWSMITPAMEPGKRYPVFIYHYGGPTAQVVSRQWQGSRTALFQYLVDRGWIVFSIDNRGTANRGRAFLDQIFNNFGRIEVTDQRAGAAWLKAQPFVDPQRLAVYGWSYGGYLTLKLLQAAPGTYAAGVSGAPVTQWDLYDTHYTERYIGMPAVQDYGPADALPDALKMRDPMLLIHGMADDNVLFDHSTRLMARLQRGAVPFETMVYPGETHRVAGPGVSRHLWETILAFLDRHVLAPTPRQE